ncbi:MAG: hypothetical protein Q8K85_18525, partial [Hyphomicrobium sp.]|nr:hypothetical protein [Hyphomicrobium sp.]
MPVARAGQAEPNFAQLRVLALEGGFAHGRTDKAQQRPQALLRLARLVHGDGLIAFVAELGLREADLFDG